MLTGLMVEPDVHLMHKMPSEFACLLGLFSYRNGARVRLKKAVKPQLKLCAHLVTMLLFCGLMNFVMRSEFEVQIGGCLMSR